MLRPLLASERCNASKVYIATEAKSGEHLRLVFLIIMFAVTAQGTLGKTVLLGASQKKSTSDSCTAAATKPGP